MASKLIIMTLNWNGADKLEKLKPSLLPALEGIDYTWFIRDNGSMDTSLDLISSWENPRIVPIKHPDNKASYSAGMNTIFQQAAPNDNDLILTLNNDVILNDTTSLHKMIEIIERDKEVGLVGAKLNYTGTKKLQHAGVLFSPRNGLPFHFRAGVEEAPRDKVNRLFPIITGAVALTRANLYANTGAKNASGSKGFSEAFFWAFDDCDFSMRISKHLQKKIVYCGETDIFHEESASLKKNPVHKLFFQQNCRTFIQTWHKHIDTVLTKRYENPKFGEYKL